MPPPRSLEWPSILKLMFDTIACYGWDSTILPCGRVYYFWLKTENPSNPRFRKRQFRSKYSQFSLVLMCKVSCLINTDSSNICNLFAQAVQDSHHFPLLFPSFKLHTNAISFTHLPLPLYPCSSLSSFIYHPL